MLKNLPFLANFVYLTGCVRRTVVAFCLLTLTGLSHAAAAVLEDQSAIAKKITSNTTALLPDETSTPNGCIAPALPKSAEEEDTTIEESALPTEKTLNSITQYSNTLFARAKSNTNRFKFTVQLPRAPPAIG